MGNITIHRLHLSAELNSRINVSIQGVWIDDEYFSRNSSSKRIGSQLTYGTFLQIHVDEDVYFCRFLNLTLFGF